jgi:hypothetical protein
MNDDSEKVAGIPFERKIVKHLHLLDSRKHQYNMCTLKLHVFFIMKFELHALSQIFNGYLVAISSLRSQI